MKKNCLRLISTCDSAICWQEVPRGSQVCRLAWGVDVWDLPLLGEYLGESDILHQNLHLWKEFQKKLAKFETSFIFLFSLIKQWMFFLRGARTICSRWHVPLIWIMSSIFLFYFRFIQLLPHDRKQFWCVLRKHFLSLIFWDYYLLSHYSTVNLRDTVYCVFWQHEPAY